MSGFLDGILSFGVQAAYAGITGTKKAKKAAEVYSRLVSEDEQVSAGEFMEMYDLRSYDFNNKSNDIKFMKTVDFQGVYMIHNADKNKYLVGKGKEVFRKISRHFRGYGNNALYEDYKAGDRVFVRAIKYDENKHGNIEKLEQEIAARYSSYTSGYNRAGI